MKSNAFCVLSIVGLVISLSGCALGDSPEGAAEAWFWAVMNRDGNKMADLTCAEQQEDLQTAGLWLSTFDILGQMLIGQSVQGDVSDLQFSVVSQSGNAACVRVTGKIRQAILAFSQTQEIDDRMGMVREGGQWKYCGVCY